MITLNNSFLRLILIFDNIIIKNTLYLYCDVIQPIAITAQLDNFPPVKNWTIANDGSKGDYSNYVGDYSNYVLYILQEKENFIFPGVKW